MRLLSRPFRSQWSVLSLGLILMGLVSGCSSGPKVLSQPYAVLRNEQSFEADFVTVWKALEETLRNFRITERHPEDVDALEMKRITSRWLQTDWIFSESRDKFQEYMLNGFPKKVYLQNRYRLKINVERVIGGTHVAIQVKEEVERLHDDGTPRGYVSVDPDPARAAEFLKKIQININAAPNS